MPAHQQETPPLDMRNLETPPYFLLWHLPPCQEVPDPQHLQNGLSCQSSEREQDQCLAIRRQGQTFISTLPFTQMLRTVAPTESTRARLVD